MASLGKSFTKFGDTCVHETAALLNLSSKEVYTTLKAHDKQMGNDIYGMNPHQCMSVLGALQVTLLAASQGDPLALKTVEFYFNQALAFNSALMTGAGNAAK